MGTPVSMSQLQPGDLVFFAGASHVGIYIGGGQFIHAPHTGDVVKISSLFETRYAMAYVGAVRPYAAGAASSCPSPVLCRRPAAFPPAGLPGSLASRYPARARPNLREHRRLTGPGRGNRGPSREAG